MTAVSPTPEEATAEIRRLQANHLLGAAEEPAQAIVDHLDALMAALRDARRDVGVVSDAAIAYQAHLEEQLADARRARDQARDALATVRAECDLPDHIAEIVGGALGGAAEDTGGAA